MSRREPPDAPSPLVRWLGPLLVAAAAVAMVVWTWAGWPDPVVRSGAQLYAPWRIAQGDQLYVDVAWFSGPLSAYLNALWFAVFGPGLRTLVVANLVVLAAMLTLLYRLGCIVGGRVAATAGCLTFVGVFGFSQCTPIGGFNWVFPNSHELTHGTVLSLLAIYCLWLYGNRRKARWLLISGFATGLAFLTTAHVSAAAFAGVGAGLVAILWVDRYAIDKATRRVGVWLLGVLAPPIVAWVLLSTSASMSASDAAGGAFGAWAYAFVSANSLDPSSWRSGVGLDELGANILAVLEWTCRYVAVLAPATILATFGRTVDRPRRWLVGLAAVVVATPLVLTWRGPWIEGVARPLPLFMLVLVVTAVSQLARRRAAGNPSRELAPQLALFTFALVMLFAMVLNARVRDDGFALAMPAATVMTMVLASWPPRWIRERQGYVPVYGVVLLLVFVGVVAGHLRLTHSYMSQKTHAVGSGSDAFRADARGKAVDEAARYVMANSDDRQTLAVVPEGVMLNYLTRRRAPTPHVDVSPRRLHQRSQAPEVTTSFVLGEPNFIAVIRHGASEDGWRFFDMDYGQRFMAWVKVRYKPTTVVEAEPSAGHRFTIEFHKARD